MPIRVALFNDTSVNRHAGCCAVMSTIFTQGAAHGFDFVLVWPTNKDWRSYRYEIKKKQIDLVLVNGEGTIHRTARNIRAQALCELGEFARDELGVPAVILNATFFDLDKKSLEKLKAFTAIQVRETASKSYLRSFGLDADWIPDFSIFSPYLEQTPNYKSGILVTDSVRKDVSAFLKGYSSQHSLEFVEMVPKISTGILRRLSSRIIAPRLRSARGLEHPKTLMEKFPYQAEDLEAIDSYVSRGNSRLTMFFSKMKNRIAQ